MHFLSMRRCATGEGTAALAAERTPIRCALSENIFTVA